MSRYAKKFAELKAKDEGAFIPFVMVGDPNPQDSIKIIEALVESGADALELGIPFSDPMADGPIIQNAGIRALSSGSNMAISFEIIAEIRQKYPDIPIGLLMYANLVYHPQLDNFYKKMAEIGVDSVLVVDVPLCEFKPFKEASLKHGIDSIFIVPPNVDESTLHEIAKNAEGYIYLMSRGGTTGLNKKTDENLPKLVALLRSLTAVPIVQGFGISTKEQVKNAINLGVDGAISGSFIVSLIEKYHHDIPELLQFLKDAVSDLKSGTH